MKRPVNRTQHAVKDQQRMARLWLYFCLTLLTTPVTQAGHAIAPAAREVSGALSGRVVFTSGGHGWVYEESPGTWNLQRSVAQEMVEDYGTVDQMNFFVNYCFNAGATVIPLRPVGFQTNEVVLDNSSPAVSFSGLWTDVTNATVYYGSAGGVGYRQAVVATNESALATYTPTIPVTGFYPVYAWVPHGANRTNQLYRIFHTGGETTLHIPHHMVGNGWVYLGSYFLNSGSNSFEGSVAISNLQAAADTNTVVIADAIRFGNGKSNSGSTYPREDEGARWWIKNSLGQGQANSIYEVPSATAPDEDRMSRPKMAKEMNRPQTGRTNRVYLSFHSNALNGTARGTVALLNSTNPTPRQSTLASLVSKEVNDDMIALNSRLEYSWSPRGNTLAGNYYEIENGRLGGEMDATILEVAFHDNAMDAALMRDPKVRNWVARSAYQGVLRYFNQTDSASLTFLPEPPSNIRAIGVTNGIKISWSLPIASVGSGTATGFVIYRSTNGYGFANPLIVNGSTATTATITNLEPDKDFYFRIAAFNAGGESLPSETVGCRWTANTNTTKVLFVNGFNRFDKTTNLRQTPTALNYQPPGKTGTIDRVMPRANNSFDYVVQHGKSIGNYGLPFDSCHQEAVTNGLVALTNYLIVLWESGQDFTNTFNSAAQTKITAFLNGNGNLFVSGSGIAASLDRAAGPSTADRAFFNNQLHADLATDSNTNSGSYNFVAVTNLIFAGNANGVIDDGTKGIYWVKSPEVLTPIGTGAMASINYSGNTNGAATIQYDGSAGGGKVVYFGFPFETITSATIRHAYLTDAFNFLGSPRILMQPLGSTIAKGSAASLYVAVSGMAPLTFQWRLNGTNILTRTNSALVVTNAQHRDAGSYSVVISNRAGIATSTNALLTIIFPRPQFTSAVLNSNSVQLAFSGEAGSGYSIETSTNLVQWFPLTNVVLTTETFQFTEAVAESKRFYRVVHYPD